MYEVCTHLHRKGIGKMEPQDSAARSTNLSVPLFGLSDQLKSAADGRKDLLDSGHTEALSSNTGQPAERALANPESAREQATLGHGYFVGLSANDYAGASDDQLLAAAKTSDGRAFEELSGRHLRSIRKRVYGIVRNLEDTEDVVQDTLLKAYRHLQDFRESCEFSTWITRIAINTALMLLRKRKSRAEVSLHHTGETDETWTMWDIPDPSPSTERKCARQEALEFVSRAINRLPPLLRCALEQYHAQGQSVPEAAGKLGITVASAKARLFRARRTLRSRLEGQHISFFDACY
jgi:RNA polymerase sigma-70 factor (ECF subfamily)